MDDYECNIETSRNYEDIYVLQNYRNGTLCELVGKHTLCDEDLQYEDPPEIALLADVCYEILSTLQDEIMKVAKKNKCTTKVKNAMIKFGKKYRMKIDKETKETKLSTQMHEIIYGSSRAKREFIQIKEKKLKDGFSTYTVCFSLMKYFYTNTNKIHKSIKIYIKLHHYIINILGYFMDLQIHNLYMVYVN